MLHFNVCISAAISDFDLETMLNYQTTIYDADWGWEESNEWTDDDDEGLPSKRLRVEKEPEEDLYSEYYKLVRINDKLNKHFQAYTYDYNITFRNMENVNLNEAIPLLGNIIQSILSKIGFAVHLTTECVWFSTHRS